MNIKWYYFFFFSRKCFDSRDKSIRLTDDCDSHNDCIHMMMIPRSFFESSYRKEDY